MFFQGRLDGLQFDLDAGHGSALGERSTRMIPEILDGNLQSELADAQRVAHMGSWSWSVEKDETRISKAMCGVFRREVIPAFAEWRGFLYSPAAWDQLNAAVQESVRAGTSYDLELPGLSGDGTPLWINARGEAILTDRGQFVGLRGTMQDITVRKHSEETKRARLARYEALFERAPVGIVISSPDNHCLDANPGMCRMLGFARDELMGLHASTYATDSATPSIGVYSDLRISNSEYNGLQQFRRKDGSTFEAETLAAQMLDGTRLEFIHDIADGKRKDARARRLVDSNAQGVMFWNLEGGIVSANDAFLATVGYTRADLEAGLIDWTSITPLEFRDLDRGALKEIATNGVCTPFEKEYFRKDGSRVSVLVGAASFADGPKEGVSFVLDITARKRGEDERSRLGQHLRDQQFYTRSLIESNIDALMTIDPAGTITDVNKQMEALTGCTRDELIGAAFKSCFTDPARAEAGTRLVLREGRATNYELTVRARDGRLTVVSFNAATLYDRHRRLQGVVAAARDITERKQFEETLREATHKVERANHLVLELNANLEQQVLERTANLESARRQLLESNERFSIAADSAGIGIWEFDVVRNLVTWDEQMYRIYGHARACDVEPYTLWVESLHRDDRARCEAQVRAAIRGDGEFDTDFRIVRPNGEIRHVKAASRTLYAADGSALTMTGVNMDITINDAARKPKGQSGTGP